MSWLRKGRLWSKKTHECIFCGTVVVTDPGDDEKLAVEAHIKSCLWHPYQEQAEKVLYLEEALRSAASHRAFRARYEVLYEHYARLHTELLGFMPEDEIHFGSQVDRAAEHLERIREQLRLHTEELQVRKDQITNLRSYLNVERAAANILKASFRRIFETAVGRPFDPSEHWAYGTTAVINKIKELQAEASSTSENLNATYEEIRKEFLRVYKAIRQADLAEGSFWKDAADAIINRVAQITSRALNAENEVYRVSQQAHIAESKRKQVKKLLETL